MKCITLRQPWASLFVAGAKIIETRSWSTPHRGPLAVHASAKMNIDERHLCFTQPFASAPRAPRIQHAGRSAGRRGVGDGRDRRLPTDGEGTPDRRQRRVPDRRSKARHTRARLRPLRARPGRARDGLRPGRAREAEAMSEAERGVREVLPDSAIHHFTRSDHGRMYVCLSKNVDHISLENLDAIAERLGTRDVKVVHGAVPPIPRRGPIPTGLYILIDGIESPP